MVIKKETLVEDCFDGSRVYVYEFDTEWNRVEIMKLEALGKLDYFPEFARPFFRVVSENGMQLKGVEGDRTCRVIFPRAGQDGIKDNFEKMFVKS